MRPGSDVTATDSAAARLADAAGHWLEALEPTQRRKATFPFDSDERFAWDYRPGERRGLAIGDMSPAQRDLAPGDPESGR